MALARRREPRRPGYGRHDARISSISATRRCYLANLFLLVVGDGDFHAKAIYNLLIGFCFVILARGVMAATSLRGVLFTTAPLADHKLRRRMMPRRGR